MTNKLKTFIASLLIMAVMLVWYIVEDYNPENLYNNLLNSPTIQPSATTAPEPVSSTREVLGEASKPAAEKSDDQMTDKKVQAKVKRVIDGDTIELENGSRVRYIGIDTPETVKPNTAVQCFGKEASQKNKSLVEGKTVDLEKDVSETDRYGRLLRYVYVDGLFVNQTLIEEGFAYASSYPPDLKYQELFQSAQNTAMSSKNGLWGVACPTKK